MIEPQNTMIPLAADPAPVDLPEGEEGFGAMLAQTLGMIPQLDPNAIQQIGGRQGDGNRDTADLTGEGNPDLAEHGQGGSFGQYAPIPITGKVRTAETPSGGRSPLLDGGFVDPTDPIYANGLPSVPEAPPEAPVLQEPVTSPLPPVTTEVPIDAGIGEPVRTGDAGRVAGDGLPESPQPVSGAEAPAPVAATPPVVTAPPDIEPPVDLDPAVPVVRPRPEPPPSAPVAPPADGDPAVAPVRTAPDGPIAAEPAQPVIADGARAVAKPNPGLPTPPAPNADSPSGKAPPVQAAPGAWAPHTSRLDTAPNSTPDIRMGDNPVRVPADSSVSLRESTARVEGLRATLPGPSNQVIAAAGAPQSAATPTPVATPAAPTQHSALAERVMQAVEMQANQPPPRTMVVDIPEIEGLRLVVSVRSGAEVHVVPASTSTATNGLHPFLEELQGVLENRGFVMTGDDRRRNGQRQDQDEPAPNRPTRPTFRSAERTDNDLRI